MILKLFTPQQLYNLYCLYVNKPLQYFKKYEKLPLEKNDDLWKWETHDFPRIPCLLDFREYIEKYKIKSPNKLLITSKEDPEPLYLTPKEVECKEYNIQTNENDLHTLNLKNKDYDFVIISQTFEHLYNPLLCLNNIKDHMISGGHIFISVPMINIPHMTPFHYWGINQMGLVTLFASLDFDILEIGQWGNKKYIDYIFTTHKWPDYRDLIDSNGVIPNEQQNICQCWILARKK